MSIELAKQPNGDAVDTPADGFKDYLRQNLTSDLVMEVLEECLLEENGQYNAITFERALKDLQQHDTGRYQMLKALLEGYAMKEGQVLLDPKLVNASYKQRVAELETLKSMSRVRRFIYRMGQAVVSLLREKGETEAIQEAIQVSGEVQMGRQELAAQELKSAQLIEQARVSAATTRETAYKEAARIEREARDLLFKASNERAKKTDEWEHETQRRRQALYDETRQETLKDRQTARAEWSELSMICHKLRQEIAILEAEKHGRIVADPALAKALIQPDQRPFTGYRGRQDVRAAQRGRPHHPYRLSSDSASLSASLSHSISPSPSVSPSPSQSPSPSPSPSPEPYDEDDPRYT